MSDWITILGGAVAGGVTSLGVASWQRFSGRRDRLADLRLDLVRRLARDKGGPELASALNEVPVVFGHDERALRLYRASVPGKDGRADTDRVEDLIVYLAQAVGLGKVDAADLRSGFASPRRPV